MPTGSSGVQKFKLPPPTSGASPGQVAFNPVVAWVVSAWVCTAVPVVLKGAKLTFCLPEGSSTTPFDTVKASGQA